MQTVALKDLLTRNQLLFDAMRRCQGCRHTDQGVHPCPGHLMAVEHLNSEWAISPCTPPASRG